GIALLVVAPCPALADAEQAAPKPALLRRAPEHPDVGADEQQRQAESEGQRGQDVAFLDRLGADLDAVVDEEFLELRIREGRQRRREVARRSRGTALRRTTPQAGLVRR